MKETGWMIISMVTVRRRGSRERLSLKANTSKERRMVVDAMNGLMEASMRAILSTASSKVKACTTLLSPNAPMKETSLRTYSRARVS